MAIYRHMAEEGVLVAASVVYKRARERKREGDESG